MERQESLSPKQLKWEQASQDIEKITDGLGRKIDEGIKESVIALNVHDFITEASCEGHVDRALPFPWIDVASATVNDERYLELRAKEKVLQDSNAKLEQLEMEEITTKIKNIMQMNLKEKARLLLLLAEINPEIEAAGLPQITISSYGWNWSRIQPEGAPKGKPSEIRKKVPLEQIEKQLQAYQESMRMFTNFLKEKFFKEN